MQLFETIQSVGNNFSVPRNPEILRKCIQVANTEAANERKRERKRVGGGVEQKETRIGRCSLVKFLTTCRKTPGPGHTIFVHGMTRAKGVQIVVLMGNQHKEDPSSYIGDAG